MRRGKVVPTDSYWRRYRGRTITFAPDPTDPDPHPWPASYVCLKCNEPFSNHIAIGDHAPRPVGLVRARFIPPWPGLYCFVRPSAGD